jgi:hypothetical protein
MLRKTMSSDAETERLQPALQRDTDRAAPIPENGKANGIAVPKVCGRCEAENGPEAERCLRCQSWLVGNPGPRTTGVYARQQPADLVMTADELERGIVADLGGIENLSTLERSHIRKLRDLEITIRLLAGDIARNNLLTPGGRVRDVYGAFLNGLDRFDRYSQRLGLKRRAKHVDIARVLSGMDK